MIKDCPISPAAKANYEVTHDKSIKGVKIVTAIVSAVANKGDSESIESVADAIDNYFVVEEKEEKE